MISVTSIRALHVLPPVHLASTEPLLLGLVDTVRQVPQADQTDIAHLLLLAISVANTALLDIDPLLLLVVQLVLVKDIVRLPLLVAPAGTPLLPLLVG